MSVARTPDDEANSVMRRLRRELAHRAIPSSTFAHTGTPGDVVGSIALPRWRPEQGELPEKSAYVLQELLQYDDEQFVQIAYQVILRRSADETGLRYYCQQLRMGGVSKVEVLGNLRWSEEGVQRGVHIDGLLLPYKFQQWRHRRWIGPVLEWAYTLARLPRLARLQAITSARGVREARRLGQLLNQVSDGIGNQADAVGGRLAVLAAELHGLEQRAQALSDEQGTRIDKLDELLAVQLGQDASDPAASGITLASRIVGAERALGEIPGQVGDGLAALESRMQVQFEEQLNTLQTSIDALSARVDGIQSCIDMQQACNADAQQSSRRVDERLDAIEGAFTSLTERVGRVADGIATVSAPPDGRNLDALYAAFEEAFRGNDALVKTRVSPYIADIASAALPGELVIDVGCGRGEWLEVLRDAGYRARGIDTNEVFVQTCRAKDLDVIQSDALEALKQLPEASVAGVTSMHLVEHLPFISLISLLDEAYRVLRPGGILILETPNPENILVGSNWFYMDPTHRNPLPPGLLFWLARARGFTELRVERLTEARDVPMPELLSDESEGAASINSILDHFRAPVDYAVIARRSA